MQRISLLACLCAFWLCVDQSQANAPARVGRFSDFKKLEIHAGEVIGAEEIRLALQRDVWLIPAARVNASFTDFCLAVKADLTRAYQNVGFADVVIQVDWNEASQVPQLTVTEGPRYLRGDVVVLGVNDDIKQSIMLWLTTPHPPVDAVRAPGGNGSGNKPIWLTPEGKQAKLEQAIWQAGQPTSFLSTYRDRVLAMTKRALTDFGHYTPQVQVVIEKDAKRQAATLKIDIQDAGPAAVVGQISVTGNERNSSDQIIELSGVKSGDPLTAELLLNAQQRIWKSGRFRLSSVKRALQIFPTESQKVQITVAEYGSVPLINEDLSPTDRIACLCADWMTNVVQHNYDFRLSFSSGTNDDAEIGGEQQQWKLDGVLSVEKGIVFKVSGPDPWRGGYETAALSFDNAGLDILLQRSGQRLHIGGSPQSKLTTSVRIDGNPKPKDDRLVSLNFSIKLATANAYADMVVSPMAAIYSIRNGSPKYETSKGILTVSTETSITKIDTKTGRLLSY